MVRPGEESDPLLTVLLQYWVKSYQKPIIITTFSESLSRLAGNHYPYTSGERAARVLIKLVEYKEYLEREGLYKS